MRWALNSPASSKPAMAANMAPLFRWCPYTMLLASEKSAAFAADRKMQPYVAPQLCSPLKSRVRYVSSSSVCTMG